jgi:adenylate cyclase
MAKKRAKFLATRTFGFVIAAAIAGIVILITYVTGLLAPLELKTLDTHFFLKNAARGKTIQEGSVYSENNPKISSDILIVGVDASTLAKLGLWPFPRSRHADLINAFSRIKEQNNRENALFLDILFVSETGDVANDEALASAIQESGRVFLETSLLRPSNESDEGEEMSIRERRLARRFGSIHNIKGDWKHMVTFQSSEAPLDIFGDVAAGYGHATFFPDLDQIFRRQPIVGKLSALVETIPLDDLKPGYAVDEKAFERLAWMDKDGVYHDIPTPLTDSSLASLRRNMESSAPRKVDEGGGEGYFIVRRFRDTFIPSITLSLALNYFGKKVDDVEVVLGKHVRIPSPTRFDPETGKRLPYEIVVRPDVIDASGNVTKAGKRRAVPYIDIPIDENGTMLINYMGPPSSDSPEGIQTYPVRPYAGYAEKAPSPDPATWRRSSMAVGNKILMVGAFASGMSSDDKQTPLGIMYGIEVHANALNTILMDNFVIEAPAIVNIAILLVLVLIVAFMSSRRSTLISFFTTLFLLCAYFMGVTTLFDFQGYLINFSSPAMAMIFTFIAIVVYRAMTEERDKKQIRDAFGKYLSPKVVDQLVENPPELGGVDKDLTVLFSDIRSFTTLSESMSPQELVNHLNTYLTAMTDIILEYAGYLDKYVGDEVMCFWGAPLPQADHAVLACKCALRQMERLHELNAGWPEAIRINIGIGVNSGIMTVGNMGSPARMNYTLMGDNVNLGARLEGTNKEYGTNIIISEFTYGLVKDKFICRELDNIRVKGKNKPVLIYELVDCLEDIAPPKLDAPKRHGRV